MLELALKNFDIEQIANSGQCFRMYHTSEDTWEVHALDEVVKIQKKENFHLFDCSENEFASFWSNYFDLNRDYQKIIERIKKTQDDYLYKAVNFGSGLRVLKQDVWEMIVTFVISQQNNIPRITKCVNNLCSLNKGKFPQPQDLLNMSSTEIESVKLGYRQDYLIKIARAILEGSFNLSILRNLSSHEAHCYLKSLYGIGDKVANCVVLFGLHKMDAFPKDVWIKRIINTHYAGEFCLQSLGLEDIGGIVQQYMYFYERYR